MRRSIVAWLVAGALVGLAGCNANAPGGLGGSASSGGPSLGSVAIVDLDEIARRLGRDLEMNRAVEEQQIDINKQLQALQKGLRKKYEDRKAELGESPQPEEQQELSVFGRQLDSQFAQEKQKAGNELSAYRVGLINRFREEVKPIAQEVAAERGLSVVVTKVDSLIYAFDPEAEITDAVVAKLAGSPADRSGGDAEPAPLTSARPSTGDTAQE